MSMYTNIGEFICQKRMENNLTLRELASMLSISLTYLADIEHDRRNPMDKAKLDELADILGLTKDEKEEMYDLAGQKRNEVAPDLTEYVVGKSYVSYALRRARDIGADEEDWLKMVESLERRTRRKAKKK
ncbi:MAG: helix-turn-helix domain-containing protein [Eubacterium sp.]|nr:helix-turn-helix domain-containing protein [Eubacterium sp.]